MIMLQALLEELQYLEVICQLMEEVELEVEMVVQEVLAVVEQIGEEEDINLVVEVV